MSPSDEGACVWLMEDGLADLLSAALARVAGDEKASTLAACLLLKLLFLLVNVFGGHMPSCSTLERLALLHWSFDVWNLWNLVQFADCGRLSWPLETSMLYHVAGYGVYSLVYLHLQRRRPDVAAAPAAAEAEFDTSASDTSTEKAPSSEGTVCGEPAGPVAPPPTLGHGRPNGEHGPPAGAETNGVDVPDELRAPAENGPRTAAAAGPRPETNGPAKAADGPGAPAEQRARPDPPQAANGDLEGRGPPGAPQDSNERAKPPGAPDDGQ